VSCPAEARVETARAAARPAPRGGPDEPSRPAKDDEVRRWTEVVLARTQLPIDAWMVAAVLEGEGLRDVDARERFGCPDLFVFAERVFAAARDEARWRSRPGAPPATPGERQGRGGLLGNLARGSSFAIPMLGQLLCVASTGHSLCASLDFGPGQATSAGLALFWSLLMTSPITSALGREGAVRRQAGDWDGLDASCRRLLRAGALGLLAGALATCVFQLATGLLAATLFAVMLLHGVALSLLWLGLACCQALRLYGFTLAATVLGALAVAAAVEGLDAPVLAAQFVAVLGVAASAFGRAALYARARRRSAPPVVGQTPGFPTPGEVAVGSLLPYAAYGLGHAGLLVVDRLLAWSAPGRVLPQPLWFHAPYELGIEWALLSALVPIAYLEHAVHRFYDALHEAAATVPLRDLSAHEAMLTSALVRTLRVLVPLSGASVLVTWVAGRALGAAQAGHTFLELENVPETRHAYWCGALAYQLLVLGLGGALLFFSLNRPLPVVKAIWRALAVATVSGFIASRALSPEHAALGLLLGATAFAAEMLAGARGLIRNGAYHEYAAF
jgi:hypothetical protein